MEPRDLAVSATVAVGSAVVGSATPPAAAPATERIESPPPSSREISQMEEPGGGGQRSASTATNAVASDGAIEESPGRANASAAGSAAARDLAESPAARTRGATARSQQAKSTTTGTKVSSLGDEGSQSTATDSMASDGADEESASAAMHVEVPGDGEEVDKSDSESRYWIRSYISESDLQSMEKEGLLPPKKTCQWRSAMGDNIPAPSKDERVMLYSHVIRGLGLPPSAFFLEVLRHYGLQPHNLTPNSVLYVAGFQALFEGYLCMPPRLDFFKYCFHIRRQTVCKGKKLAVCGTVSFYLRRKRGWYPKVPKIDSVKSWTGTYFYCKATDESSEIPVFSNVPAVEQPSWREEAVKALPKDLRAIKKKIETMTSGTPKLTGVDTVICWLHRRIQPLRRNAGLLCTYTGEDTDPLRIGNDLSADEFTYRLNQLVSVRTQYEESFPMFCTANPVPQETRDGECDLTLSEIAAGNSSKRKRVVTSAAAERKKRKEQKAHSDAGTAHNSNTTADGITIVKRNFRPAPVISRKSTSARHAKKMPCTNIPPKVAQVSEHSVLIKDVPNDSNELHDIIQTDAPSANQIVGAAAFQETKSPVQERINCIPATNSYRYPVIKEEAFDDRGYILPSFRDHFIHVPAQPFDATDKENENRIEHREAIQPPPNKQHMIDLTEDSIESHREKFELGISILREQFQLVENAKNEIFDALTEKKAQSRYLATILEAKEATISQLTTEQKKNADLLDKAKDITEYTETIRQLRAENQKLHSDNQKQEEELDASKKATADSETSSRMRAAKDAETIVDLQSQLSRRLDEIGAVDNCLLVPAGLGENLSPDIRLTRIHQLAGLLDKFTTDVQTFVHRINPDRVTNAVSVADLPALFGENVEAYEERIRSAIRGGAKVTLGLVMAHYPEVEAGRVAAGFPTRSRNGDTIDENKVLQSVSGYASKIAKSVNTNATVPEESCPPTPEYLETSSSEDDEEIRDADEEVSASINN